MSELLDAVKAGEITETIRTSLTWALQRLIEDQLTAIIGAGRHKRSESRTNLRNGHRPKLITTAAGDVELQIHCVRFSAPHFG